MEKIKKGKAQIMTEHLNTIDTTGNIKFTHEEEEDCSLAFLDVKVRHIDDGSKAWTTILSQDAQIH